MLKASARFFAVRGKAGTPEVFDYIPLMLAESNDAVIAPQEAVRLAKAAVVDFDAECFWFRAKDAPLETVAQIRLIIRWMRTNGGRKAWFRAMEIEECL